MTKLSPRGLFNNLNFRGVGLNGRETYSEVGGYIFKQNLKQKKYFIDCLRS